MRDLFLAAVILEGVASDYEQSSCGTMVTTAIGRIADIIAHLQSEESQPLLDVAWRVFQRIKGLEISH